MTTSNRDLEAALALTRFGLGARSGEIEDARGDPRAYLRAQIRPSGADIPTPPPETAAQRLMAGRALREARQAAKAAGADAGSADEAKRLQRQLRRAVSDDILARARLASSTPAGFRERWALFWANHFTVSASKAGAAGLVGPFEAEAIRPHVFGRFETLLVAAETHPAMLIYLDQVKSVGPDSLAATRVKRRGGRGPSGLNENLAREILELHTVGVDAGYTQADVTEFARALTGLSLADPREEAPEADMSAFRDAAHEPGARTVMGKRYAQAGQDQAQAILSDLAAKPQTARFICRKLARHFVADSPPPELVGQLTQVWMDTGGHLGQVAEALIGAPQAWTPDAGKLKTPYEFLVSAWRIADVSPGAAKDVAAPLTTLGQRPFTPPSPKGWADDAATWAAPDAVIKRMVWSQSFAAANVQDRDPADLARQGLGASLSSQTLKAVTRAESRAEGLALLLMSPEFQRR